MTKWDRFSNWISPDSINGLTFLDIGCRESAAGEYVMTNGAREYVGIDIKIIDNNNLKKFANASTIEISADNFLKTCHRKFDVAFVGMSIFGISDCVGFLQKLSTVANTIIIESVNPYPANLIPNNNDSNYDKILYELEYNYPVALVWPTNFIHSVNSIAEDRYLVFLYSIGFLKTILNRLGFIEDLSTYELLKIRDPERYGYGMYSDQSSLKKFIITFNLVKDPLPLTWNEWVNV